MLKKIPGKKKKCDECKRAKKTEGVVLKKGDNEIHVRFCKTCTKKYEKSGWKAK